MKSSIISHIAVKLHLVPFIFAPSRMIFIFLMILALVCPTLLRWYVFSDAYQDVGFPLLYFFVAALFAILVWGVSIYSGTQLGRPYRLQNLSFVQEVAHPLKFIHKAAGGWFLDLLICEVYVLFFLYLAWYVCEKLGVNQTSFLIDNGALTIPFLFLMNVMSIPALLVGASLAAKFSSAKATCLGMALGLPLLAYPFHATIPPYLCWGYLLTITAGNWIFLMYRIKKARPRPSSPLGA